MMVVPFERGGSRYREGHQHPEPNSDNLGLVALPFWKRRLGVKPWLSPRHKLPHSWL